MRWPQNASEEEETRLLEAARWHGVEPLLADAVRDAGRVAGWPERVRATLADRTRAHAIAQSLRDLELARVLAALDEVGVQPLLFKGAQLAYTHYASSALRPRVDTDLLIRKADGQATKGVMDRLGYRRGTLTSGELVTYQFFYQRQDPWGLKHAYDIHWKVADPQLFADLFSFGELVQDAVRLPAISGHARGLSAVHALLVACVHRIAHHHNSTRLIWHYDTHLLAGGMDGEQFDQLVQLATERRVRAVCARSLALAQRRFGTPVPPAVLEQLGTGVAAGPAEPSAIYLDDGLRKVDILMSDLRCLPSWRARLRLLREHLFPPAAYMLASYAVSRRAVLPFLYAHRILRGAARWLRPLER